MKYLKNLHWSSQVLLLFSILLSTATYLTSHINNWRIFRHSFFHLLEGKNLYLLYPDVATDIMVYSPTFALLVAPLSLLPVGLGGILWNLVGAFGLVSAFEQFDFNNRQKKFIFWIILPEFIGSTQNFQANIHIIALLLWFWISLERGWIARAALAIVISFYVKLFGIVALSLFLYSHYLEKNLARLTKFIALFAIFMCAFFFAPALISGLEGLFYQYQEWFKVLSGRDGTRHGFSLMGIVYGFTQFHVTNLAYQIPGALTLIASILYHRKKGQLSRLMSLVSVCYFVIFFNNQAESPTFIIALVGFAIHQNLIENQKLRWSLIALTLFFFSVLYSDPLRPWSPIFNQYAVKSWPLLILYPMAILQVGLKMNRPTPLLSQTDQI